MKLYFAPPSPFARKARVVVLEKGLAARVEMLPVNPMENPAKLLAANPLGKIPALQLDDGSSLYDSPVICEYLDSLSPAPALFDHGPGRFAQLGALALVDGLLDAAVAVRMEALRPEDRRWPQWVERQTGACGRALDALDGRCAAWGGAVDMVQLGCAVALEYLDFRLPELDWRAGRPRLAAWQAGITQRPSLQSTRPT